MPVTTFGVKGFPRDPKDRKIKLSDTAVKGELSYDFGGNLEGAVEKFGEEVVYSNFVAGGKVVVQGVGRAVIEAGGTIQEAQEKVNGYKLGIAVQRVKKSSLEAAAAEFQAMPPEKQKEYLDRLTASIKTSK